ncbi:MAG: LeuA family protein [Thermodesulfobacteriota bacterium]
MKGIIDSTLREGAQTPGVAFSPAAKVAIARLLDRLGIEEIELGIATPRDRDLNELMRRCRGSIRSSRLALWCRCRPEDIDHAVRLGPDVLSLSIPASDLHIRDRLGRDRQWVEEKLRQAIEQAIRGGIGTVSVGLEDATRAELPFLIQLARTAAEAGAHRLRLADTVGIASPAMISALVRETARCSSLEIGVHTHNDFGMATANAIAALEAGAQWADATVLGLGERAGNSRLEEIVGYLALGRHSRSYQTHYLRSLCRIVAKTANRTIADCHPVVGEAIFTCETGLHLQGLVRNPATYEPYDPIRVGGCRRLLLGGKAGKRAVSDRLRGLGITLEEKEMERLTTLVRQQANSRKRPLDDDELRSLVAM